MYTFLEHRTSLRASPFMNGVGLATMGDEIRDDPLLRSPLHHYRDEGRVTFFVMEIFVVAEVVFLTEE